MKKLFYILIAAFMVASCCDIDDEKKSEYITHIYVDNSPFSVYKVKIENHTHIIVTSGHRFGLEHDPECPYCKEHGFPEHKLETTDY